MKICAGIESREQDSIGEFVISLETLDRMSERSGRRDEGLGWDLVVESGSDNDDGDDNNDDIVLLHSNGEVQVYIFTKIEK